MTGFLLDTNIVSELRRRDRADPGVMGWMEAHAADDLWLSVLTVGELRRGVEQLGRRDTAAGRSLTSWLDSVVDEFGDRLLPVTRSIAERWGVLNVPDPLPAIDGMLAATAIEHRLTLVTRNVADVNRSGVDLVNPFTTG